MTSTTQDPFYLYSSQNRRLYPISDYPITHLLDRINIHCRMLKQPIYIKRFLYAFIFLLLWTLFDTFFFRLHAKIYNATFGPFHFNQKQFVEYVNQYKNDQSFLPQFGRIEYIQVELNEDNIQNSIGKYDTIRRYSNPRTRDNHIATYKKITHPSIYVKLPTNSQKRFHLHHPIHFQSYSIQTLQCIVRNLPFNSAYTYRTWTEKSEYIQYINEEYAKNSTEFNKAVLTKCGVLIGFLYRPRYERGFTGRGEHTFTSDDIALNMTHSYYFFYLLLFFGLIFICLCLICLIYFILYLSNIIKFKVFHPFGIWSLSLKLSPDVIEELYLLNVYGSPHEQLLELDRLIKESSNKYAEKLVIIRNASDDLFVVLLKMNENEGLDLTDESSPFIVCPATDIRKTTHNNGICYGKDSSWIPWPWPWPVIVTEENEYANWLHHRLIEISDVYKQRHEQRLRYEPNSEPLQDGTHPILRLGTIEYRNTRQRRPQVNTTVTHNSPLSALIHEENNNQRFKIERQTTIEYFNNLSASTSPATAEFIARFRLEHEHNHQVVNEDMMKEQNTCTVCMEDLKINQFYARWPCSDAVPHLFHYDCMLELLRMRNTCPNCRYEVEDTPIE
ncbi:unnamed protein product [Adineta steineri]|uniref:RING-type domain-containing protein n=1 Tax=Adineta steineri TaxID=433720 RepID=A0A814F4E5_9BILA|nr:unnamed protein product [Adineta steineri]CAF0944181.1 unnamed protein product [Adineta steineri]CAF0978057.1 unnamed protein product [Adineta steineri]